MNKTNEHTTPGLIRSSAAEYLTFIASAGDQEQAIEVHYEDERIFLTQKMLARSYEAGTLANSGHPKSTFDGMELTESSVVKRYLTATDEGKSFSVRRCIWQALVAVSFDIEIQRASHRGTPATPKPRNSSMAKSVFKVWTMCHE